MAYFQGSPMNGFEMSMDMAVGGLLAANAFGSANGNAVDALSFNLDTIGAQDQGNTGNQGTAAFVNVPAVSATSAPPVNSYPVTHDPIAANTTPIAPVAAPNPVGQQVPVTANVGEAKQPRQPCRAGTDDPENYTDVVPSQSSWSFHNLPDILYVFRGPDRPRGNINVPLKPSPWPENPPIRAFDLLPDRVSSNVEEFRVEAWMRLDRRIQLRDITDRMNPKYRIYTNTLQQRGVRFRQAFSLASWGVSSKQTDTAIETIRSKLIEKGIDLNQNTTRGLTPGTYTDQNGITQRIPTPNQYSKRPDTTIRRGMAARNLTLAPALVQGTQTHTPNTTPERKGAASKFILVTPPSVTPSAEAISVTPPPATMPTATAPGSGLPTPSSSPANTMPAQAVASAAADVISDPQAAYIVAPNLSASGNIRGARAPNMETASNVLAGRTEDVHQECQNDPDLEEAILRTSIMQDYLKRCEEERPQKSREAESYSEEDDAFWQQPTPISDYSDLDSDTADVMDYLNAWVPVVNSARKSARSRASTQDSQPMTISNPEKTLRKVQNRHSKRSISPRIHKNPIWKDRRSVPTWKRQQLQRLHNSRSNTNPRETAQTVNNCLTVAAVQPGQQMSETQIPSEISDNEDIELLYTSDDEDIELFDASDEEYFEDLHRQFGLNQDDQDYHTLENLNGDIVRNIIQSNPSVKTDGNFLRLCREYIKSHMDSQMQYPQKSELTSAPDGNASTGDICNSSTSNVSNASIAADGPIENIKHIQSLQDLIKICEHQANQQEQQSPQASNSQGQDSSNEDTLQRLSAEAEEILTRPLHQYFGMTETELIEYVDKYGHFGPTDFEY
ncbi:hypothetical protein H105_04315 [Trichophyton soudanense CBS 452.61]|uniref:Clr5 domain-containing protein n=1 Tax=Trichophyton soudanense CBS 452.61 TaxID=1215331 RepID=A0A022XTC0_TRISD|nr:hypothetical protein H105_04315 [Trichophyton soudanense CBS 452.61]EZG06343.1 hypothetical protein H106_04117 [Trichophyton rubrum CBS 735.88]